MTCFCSNGGTYANRLKYQLTIVVFITIFLTSSTLVSQTKKPNIIIMMTDDQGFGDIGMHGNPYLKTPNMEAIAEEGIEMVNFLAYPNCSASRAALLTGRYPYRTGVTAVTQVDHFMNTSELTIAEILKDNGYRTFGR